MVASPTLRTSLSSFSMSYSIEYGGLAIRPT
jgi:hypothetical protein